MAYSREIEKLERQFAENPRRFAAPFADALRKSDEVARALEVIQVGLELNPEYIPGSVILGRCHLDLGDDDAAEAAFSRVLDLDNENVIALKSLADITERQGRNDEAVRFLTYLLEVDRSNDEAREQLARIQAQPVAAAREPSLPPVEEASLPDAEAASVPEVEAPESPAAPVSEFLEPTTLWEAPVDATEAPISSWVEPTSSSPLAPPELGDSILDEEASLDEVAPVEGLDSAEFRAPLEDIPVSEFVVEREEEIILTSMAGAEYRVRNDSEDLLHPPEEEEAEEEVTEEAATETPAAFEPEEPEAVDESPIEPVEDLPVRPSSAIAAELDAASDAAVAEEAPVLPAEEEEAEESPGEWAMHVSEERGFVPAAPTHTGAHPPDSFDAAIEGIAPVEDVAEPGTDDAADQEQEAGAEEVDGAPVLVVTESMAELYAAQGHATEALGVYRILFDRNPDNDRLRQRIQDLESALAAQVLEDAAPSYAASVTGGEAVASFLGGMLQARPAQVDIPEPPPAPDIAGGAADSAEEGDTEAVASGAPTRPAADRVSLGAIFGEDPSPVHPAENAPAAESPEGAGGFSFDEFFGGATAPPSGRTSAGSVRTKRPADSEDDLDQFHVWLQSLKR